VIEVGEPKSRSAKLAELIGQGRFEQAYASIRSFETIGHDKNELNAHYWYLASLASWLTIHDKEAKAYEKWMRRSSDWSKLAEGNFRREAAYLLMRIGQYSSADYELRKARELYDHRDTNLMASLHIARGVMLFITQDNTRAYGFHQTAEHELADQRYPNKAWVRQNQFYLLRLEIALGHQSQDIERRFNYLMKDQKLSRSLRLRAKTLHRFGPLAVHLDRQLEQRLYQ
jgi:tetratricopeptide (TPR) repeat protein